jgi:hypothetical protein
MGDSNSKSVITVLHQIVVDKRKLSATPTSQGTRYLISLTKVLEAIAQQPAHTLQAATFEVIK